MKIPAAAEAKKGRNCILYVLSAGFRCQQRRDGKHVAGSLAPRQYVAVRAALSYGYRRRLKGRHAAEASGLRLLHAGEALMWEHDPLARAVGDYGGVLPAAVPRIGVLGVQLG